MEREHQWSDPNKRGDGANVSTDALFSLVGDDEVIMRRTKLLVNMMLENAFQTMLSGTTAERTALSRALMPSIVKMLAARDQDGVGALRQRMDELFAKMGGEVMPPPTPTTTPVPPPPGPISPV